ncbi:CAF17-like 4Fe-4S cluster assembly/insertion protein YgfZ [Arboricoccus pini]|uniref:CAF17-like 4Fe-4S cluster assembly/insertion protein YgfZ n=1 Tax=Arboricoccus pini TaxID=1963835 RepID=UPI001FAEE1FD|nr:folate-binding protein [Arboricoccus pini]
MQALISNDTSRLSASQALYAALLTPQGKYLFDFFLYDDHAGVLLESREDTLDDLQRRLTLYRLRTAVEITRVQSPPSILALFGQDVFAVFDIPAEPGTVRKLGELRLIVDPRRAEMGVRVMGPFQAVSALAYQYGAHNVTLSAYERHRIELGVPEGGVDLLPNQSILLESNFEELHGVAFDKGCYIGQELTARTKYRGLVKKRLVPVAIDGQPPAAGELIMADHREAGEIRSVAGDRALALLRLDYLDGQTQLRSREARILPLPLPWAKA